MIVDTVTRIAKLAGLPVVAFAPFKPYDLQRVRITDQHLGQVVRREWVGIPKKYDAPTDRFEYEDWIQEKAMEKWRELADRHKEQLERKRADREEVLRVTEEKWGAEPLVSLRHIHELDEKSKKRLIPVDPLQPEPDVHSIHDDATVVLPE
jgi:hypothetical protein